jgi:hypothetical protein
MLNYYLKCITYSLFLSTYFEMMEKAFALRYTNTSLVILEHRLIKWLV